MENNQLTKINSFTRRNFSEDEVYIFDVILCDNEIDRDAERFSHNSLLSLQKLFIGKTGISDHNPKSENQLARIFDTQLIKDNSRLTSWGEPYEYLKASVYMIRTDANKDLIAEIEGGIKKEVSISCSAQKKKCSVCGCDKDTAVCSHMKGRMYSGKLCHTVLDDVTDAYEWSFVAVPAQVNAGVTKHYTENETHFTDADVNALKNARQDIFRDIIRLAFMNGGEVYSKSVSDMAENLDMQSLITLKHKLEKNIPTEIGCQLFEENEESVEAFSIK